MTIRPLPNLTASDGFWCPSCEIHRTTAPTRKCPCCKGDENEAKKEATRDAV